jgi:maltooligosyltrehalose synthase
MRGKMQAPLGEVWEGAELTLPENLPSSFENLFTGERLNRSEKGTLLCREIFARFPVAVLVGV